MTKRKLNQQEFKMTTANIDRLEGEKEYLMYLEKHAKLLLDEGLLQNYKTSVREYTAKYAEVQSKLELISKELSILKSQIVDGVEMKEAKKEE